MQSVFCVCVCAKGCVFFYALVCVCAHARTMQGVMQVEWLFVPGFFLNCGKRCLKPQLVVNLYGILYIHISNVIILIVFLQINMHNVMILVH